MKIPPLRPLVWVLYPAGVVVLVLFTLNFLLGGQGSSWTKLVEKQKSNSQNQKTLVRLQEKLASLQKVNPAQITQDIGWMITVMPDRKQYDRLVYELQYAAQVSGSTLVSYKSASAELTDLKLNAELQVPDFSVYQKLMASIQNTLPLLSVTNVVLDGSKLKLDVDGAWAPVASASVKIDEPLPNFNDQITKLKTTLSKYQQPIVVSAEATTSTQLADPFGPLPKSNLQE